MNGVQSSFSTATALAQHEQYYFSIEFNGSVGRNGNCCPDRAGIICVSNGNCINLHIKHSPDKKPITIYVRLSVSRSNRGVTGYSRTLESGWGVIDDGDEGEKRRGVWG